MLADERPAAAQRLDGPLDVDGVVGQLALGLAHDAEQRRDAAVDVELRVVEGGAGPGGDRVQLVAVLAQVPAEGLEQAGALVEGQLPQRRAADPPPVLQHPGHVDAGGGDPGDLVAGHGVVQWPAFVGGGVPGALHVAAQHVVPLRPLDERPFGCSRDASMHAVERTTGSPTEPPVLVERDEVVAAVAVVTLNRPERRNALTVELKEALRDALAGVAADTAVRAVVLTGSGRRSAWGRTSRSTPRRCATIRRPHSDTVERHYNPIVSALAEMPKPVVAAVNGTCVGAGLGFALACDLRIAAAGAQFATAFAGDRADRRLRAVGQLVALPGRGPGHRAAAAGGDVHRRAGDAVGPGAGGRAGRAGAGHGARAGPQAGRRADRGLRRDQEGAGARRGRPRSTPCWRRRVRRRRASAAPGTTAPRSRRSWPSGARRSRAGDVSADPAPEAPVRRPHGGRAAGVRRPVYDAASLLAVAVGEFNTRGYDATSMEDLSRAAGITKSSFYHHVAGKEELLRAALERALDGLFAILDERHAATGPRRRPAALHRAPAGRGAAGRAALRDAAAAGAGQHRDRALGAGAPPGVRRASSATGPGGGRRRADAADVDPAVAARLLSGTVNSVVEWCRPDRPTVRPEDGAARGRGARGVRGVPATAVSRAARVGPAVRHHRDRTNIRS